MLSLALLFVFVFSSPNTSLGEETAGPYASCTFVCLFARVNFCPFSLPLGASDSLRLVIWALLSFVQVQNNMFSIILPYSIIVALAQGNRYVLYNNIAHA